MIRILKYLGYLILGVLCALLVAFWIFDEEIPKGEEGEAADAMARAMMQAVNVNAWDSIPLIQWTFKDEHTFQWDKLNHHCLVSWEGYQVKLDINKQSGKVYQNGLALTGAQADEKIKQAWDFFNNDSFWLNAVVKAFDDGTSRSLVQLKDGRDGLMVHYESGGTTPGDHYVWILDEHQRPVAWKMWVKILPLGGMEFSWEDWIKLPGGAQIATTHKFNGLRLGITEVKVAQNWSELGFNENPLSELVD